MNADKRRMTTYWFVLEGVAGRRPQTLFFDRAFRCEAVMFECRFAAGFEFVGFKIGPVHISGLAGHGPLPIMAQEFAAGQRLTVRFENADHWLWRWFRRNRCRVTLQGYWLREANA